MEATFTILYILFNLLLSVISQTHSDILSSIRLPTKISHIVTYNNSLVAGGSNFIYHLSSNLTILHQQDIQDDSVSLLTLMWKYNDAGPMLFWCGTAGNQSCHLNPRIGASEDILMVDYMRQKLAEFSHSVEDSSHRMTMEKVKEFQLFGRLGANSEHQILPIAEPRANQTTFIITTTVNVRSLSQHAFRPSVCMYRLEPVNDATRYHMQPALFNPIKLKLSYLTPHYEIYDQFPIYTRKLLEYNGIVISVNVQHRSIPDYGQPQNSKYHTVISTYLATDRLFTSYAESKARCRSEVGDFNIAVTADIVKTEDISQLYVVFGERAEEALSPYPTSKRSAVCSFPLPQIFKLHHEAVQNCTEGRGEHVDWYYGKKDPCVLTLDTNGKPVQYKPIVAAPVIKMNNIKTVNYNVTMLYTRRQTNTVLYLGTDSGRVLKVDGENGAVYGSVVVNKQGGEINPQTVTITESNQQQLVVMSGYQISKLPLDSCSLYTSSLSCVRSNDPLQCGWCDGKSCTTRLDCASAEWYNMTVSPTLTQVEPLTATGLSKVCITVTGEHMQPSASQQVSVQLIGSQQQVVECEIKVIETRRLVCQLEEYRGPTGEMKLAVSIVSYREKKILSRTYFEQSFTLATPVVHSMSPTSGPSCGGTNLTISGINLDVGKINITVAGNSCQLTSKTATEVKCLVPAAKGKRYNYINIKIDEVLDNNTSLYHYLPDPVILTSRLKHDMYISESSTIQIMGSRLNSLRETSVNLKFTVFNQTIIRLCMIRSATSIECPVDNITTRIHQYISHIDNIHHESLATANMYIDTACSEEKIGTITLRRDPLFYSATMRGDKTEVVIQGTRFIWIKRELLIIKLSAQICYPLNITAKLITSSCTVVLRNKRAISTDQQTVEISYNGIRSRLPIDEDEPDSDVITLETISKMKPERIIIFSLLGVVLVLIFIGVTLCYMYFRAKSKGRPLCKKEPERRLDIQMIQSKGYESPQNQIDDDQRAICHNSELCSPLPRTGLMEKIKNCKILISSAHLHVGAEIGSGCFGRVYKGVYDKKIGEQIKHEVVAIKSMRERCVTESQIEQFIKEALLCSGFRHKNVLTTIGITFSRFNQPLVVMQYLSNGDLLSYLHKNGDTLTLRDLVKFSCDVASGMWYLESVGCIHRDLAARNCMLDDDLNVKVADFGLSRDMINQLDAKLVYESQDKQAKLPVKWMAPESFTESVYSSKSDVWSYGVTLYEIFSRGSRPYSSIENYKVLSYIQNGNRLLPPENCPKEIYEVMRSCWLDDPISRPKFAQLHEQLDLILQKSNYQQKIRSQASVHELEWSPRSLGKKMSHTGRPQLTSHDSGVSEGVFSSEEEEPEAFIRTSSV